jgi:hypothetical protein
MWTITAYLMEYNLDVMKKKSSITTMGKETTPLAMEDKTMVEIMEDG